MIVKILSSAKNFGGVRYNTDKIQQDKGELVKATNFGALGAMSNLRPSDYINYLELQTSASKKIKNPQFHVAISCKGRSHSKEELTEIAEKWLKGMGYEKQPYLLIFHKDTKNNHIHIVSTRVGRDGKKISDSYEKLRSYEVLNRVMGNDEKIEASKSIQKALKYCFSTRAQFMMILENRGYSITLDAGKYQISKFGKNLGEVSLDVIDNKIGLFQKDLDRLSQIRAIFHRYKLIHDPSVRTLYRENPGGERTIDVGYTSDLAELFRSKFGIQILFHGKPGKPPYGYTVIDHACRNIYKGGDLMPLLEFISVNNSDKTLEPARSEDSARDGFNPPANKSFSVINSIVLDGISENDSFMLPDFQIDIRDDIDDEAIHGRNRRRKRKSRTNTR
ncbi:relaxase/mobilization nuclease domain-containing protein [Sphingobacterium sp. UBA5980]|uniref:relaxase/mobilization nuclease domain-containing protein n=1 Tax=Sphingobacterium sp. UBA5980 TaxID=1947504 RepID=UPI00257DD6B8|nr:relaxase/mobilization nuclease domain-containing protein [Sphingobacterium sp. UBA5980]